MKMPCKSSRAGGAPSRTDALIGPAACGRGPNPDSLKRRASARSLSLDSLEARLELFLARQSRKDGPLEPRPKTGCLQAVSKWFKLNSLFCVIWALTSAQVVTLRNLG